MIQFGQRGAMWNSDCPEVRMSSAFNLERFIEAQDRVYETVLHELRAGDKRSHWMWFIFPQVRGLGESTISQRYAIGSQDEARAYKAHPILGTRLIECTQIVVELQNRTAEQIFSYPDNLKFRSCMTLFQQATNDEIFRIALLKDFKGEPDKLTIDILKSLHP